MFSAYDKEWVIHLVQRLHLPEDYGPCDDGYINLDTVTSHLPVDVEVNYGMSRLVLIPKFKNFVIKINFNGMWKVRFSEDEESEDEDYFDYFTGDVSAYEMSIIKSARENGFSDLFLNMDYLGTIDTHMVYIQEKARIYADTYIQPSEKSRNLCKTFDATLLPCAPTWIACVIDNFGQLYWESFIRWDSCSGFKLFSDMHDANYGYTEENSPKFIDIGGSKFINFT